MESILLGFVSSSQLSYVLLTSYSLRDNLACSLIVKFNMMEFAFAPEEKLAPDRMMMKFSPKDPGVDEDVTFSVHLNYSVVSVYSYSYPESKPPQKRRREGRGGGGSLVF